MFNSTQTHSQHQVDIYDPTAPRGTPENPWSREDMGTDAFRKSSPKPVVKIISLSEDEKTAALDAALESKRNPTPDPVPKKEYTNNWYGVQQKEKDDRLAGIQSMINEGSKDE